jgi:hypothetical protein
MGHWIWVSVEGSCGKRKKGSLREKGEIAKFFFNGGGGMFEVFYHGLIRTLI